MNRLEILTYPNLEPIDCAFISDFLRTPSENLQVDVAESLITAAREWAESYLGYKVSPHKLKVYFDDFQEILHLPYAKLISIESVKYVDSNGEEQTIAPGEYEVDDKGLHVFISPVSGGEWPTVLDSPDSVYITYNAGFPPIDGDVNANIPSRIKTAIAMMTCDIYINRSAQTGANLYENKAVESLLHPLRVLSI